MTPVILAAAAAFFAPASPSPLPVSWPPAAAGIERCEAMLRPSLERFDRARSVSDARSALRAARAARECLENLAVSPRLEEARREELTFFNHVITGISRWLEAPGRPDARRALDGILRRGRAHRERGREAAERRR